MEPVLINGSCLLFGLFFLFTGVTSFIRPKRFAETLGLSTLGASGLVEVRAQYGGFFTIAGIAQFAPFFDVLEFADAFFISSVIFVGLILGRVGALAFKEQSASLLPMIQALFLIDGVGAALSLSGWLAAVGVGGT